MRTEYADSALVRQDGPFMGNLLLAENALCPDGKRRNAYPTGDGLGDTYFSIPAYVNVRHEGKNVRVYGYISVDWVKGKESVAFHPYYYRKYWTVIVPDEELLKRLYRLHRPDSPNGQFLRDEAKRRNLL